jgi:4-alpha-glucanotransferase
MQKDISSWGIEPGYIDARGAPQITPTSVLTALERSLQRVDANQPQQGVIVLRDGRVSNQFNDETIVTWSLRDSGGNVVAASNTGQEEVPQKLASGSYLLQLSTAERGQQTIPVLIAPAEAYQPSYFDDGRRAWLLMVQLYAVRSTRNWGHGDFGDLARLLTIASKAGAAGIGLNPLHALAPGRASPYSPNSRRFLNPLYIDIDSIPEFSSARDAQIEEAIAQLRNTNLVDYGAVNAAKYRALAAIFAEFERAGSTERRNEFLRFRSDCGSALSQFSAFEASKRDGNASRPALHAFAQWIAHTQLESCACLAKELKMPIGLYMDIAVGVDPSGADTLCAPNSFVTGLTVGAPPDIFNPMGQNWELATFHPQVLIDTDFAQFRDMLRSAMRYAGAIRLDHALGLFRLFLIPAMLSPREGAYVKFPFEALLAVIAQESVAARCLVIGEDLGTVPEGVCDALNDWGIWSYRVALFEYDGKGRFRDACAYPMNAVVTFNTHDLPTFVGWQSAHDLATRRNLHLLSGESTEERQQALMAFRATLAHHGISSEISLPNALRYLARTPTKLLAISLEDILGLSEQPNMPGTVDEHPNWRQRLPLDVDQLASHQMFLSVSAVLADEGRHAQ